MIPVERASEPDCFESLVRQPGVDFLKITPNPTTKQYLSHSYWRRIRRQLHDSYVGICAYSCHYISLDTGSDTVEHFIPKSVSPSLAYEWDNYRLVCGRLNARKRHHQDVLDPFGVRPNMFILNFPSLLVKPNPNLTGPEKDAVLSTIGRLKLNDDETCVSSRKEYLECYCEGQVTFDYLQSHAPFIAIELERQELTDSISDIMRFS